MKRYFPIIFLFAAAPLFIAGQTPAPAPAQQQPVYIYGATAHLGNGQVIENSAIAFDKGKITFVGEAGNLREGEGHLRINATGKHIYPGFIAPATNLGLVDIEAVRATRDFREVGSMNPNVRSLIAYNTDSEIIPTVRCRGVLLAQVRPEGGRISGLSSVVQLDAWNWEDAAYRADDGLFLNWPGLASYNRREQRLSTNKEYEKQVQEVRDFFAEAKAYLDNPAPAKDNLKYDALRPVLEGKTRLYVQAQEAREIMNAVQLAAEFNMKLAIVDGRDAWMVADMLKAHDVAVVLRATQSLPARVDSDVDQPFKTPALLQQAGLLFCFGMDGFWEQRNLPFQAGQAVGYGLDYEQAVAALTSNTARILGIGDRTGTLEVGKDANLFISEGDALDIRSSQLIRAFIQGREINLDNKQKAWYRKFKAKYDEGR
ncbi:MAG: amidohydrolase family protein [Lewinellaceae bacterium]|nr:amidohydrolase family protein [Lewinellaceae bacterium]